jgi:serine/threonine protein kinase
MAISVGTRLGSHEISPAPEEFFLDADRIVRFQREAEVLASLNHPNIAAIYDLAEAKGTRFLVL